MAGDGREDCSGLKTAATRVRDIPGFGHLFSSLWLPSLMMKLPANARSILEIAERTHYQSSDNCSVSQILEMKKLGLSDSQIKRSCASAR